MTQTKTSRPGGQSGAAQENSSSRETSTKAEVTAFARLFKPPPYGSPEWQALADVDPRKREALVHAAESWLVINSNPHVAEILAEIIEWDRRRYMSESTAAMASLRDWSRLAGAPTFAEIERRRHVYTTPVRTPEQIRAATNYSWRLVEQQNGRAAA
jgi:hypothetical protein